MTPTVADILALTVFLVLKESTAESLDKAGWDKKLLEVCFCTYVFLFQCINVFASGPNMIIPTYLGRK